MRRDSKELADRIDVMVAFQNGEEVQHRTKGLSGSWVTTGVGSSLSFDFRDYEYRLLPKPREGYVHPNDLHPIQVGCSMTSCIHVREVTDG